ncbi:Arginase/deacetylase [Dendrothele bispora CBS 962.96]|uniref:Arginase/deacetylase n=1 Tax=Dendrothele bispora (strain CBS 962.96) TaxID=1314807 RepID=A0A4S8LUW2_DENBC|nr:Arginase/deacetylase [Dendrothele bispora CBS 962.96]
MTSAVMMSPPSAVAYVVSQDLVKHCSRLPSNVGRSILVHSLVDSLGLFSNSSSSAPDSAARRRIQIINPKRASYKDLAAYHSRDYLEFVLSPWGTSNHDQHHDRELNSSNPRDLPNGRQNIDNEHEAEAFGLIDDCPIFEGMSDYIQLVAGATLTAANALKVGAIDIAICWDGGRHHAQKSRASGFCYVADCVLAILLLKRAPPLLSTLKATTSSIVPPDSSLSLFTPPRSEPSATSDDVFHVPGVDGLDRTGTGPTLPSQPSSYDTTDVKISTSISSPQIMIASPRTKSRVMYLDLDIHFGDGVAQAFYSPQNDKPNGSRNNRQVLTLSIHHTSPGFFPSSPLGGVPRFPEKNTEEMIPGPTRTSFNSATTVSDPYTLSIPLLPGAGCSTYASVWLDIVERVRNAFEPDYLVVQCGVDGLSGDGKIKVGNWSLGGRVSKRRSERREGSENENVDTKELETENEHEDLELEEGSLGWCISRIVNHWPGKKLFLGGGGYNHPNAARAWAFLTSVIAGNPLPLSTPIPHNLSGEPDEPFQFFPAFAPSFTLDVPPGNMRDMNTEEFLGSVKKAFEGVYKVLEDGKQI